MLSRSIAFALLTTIFVQPSCSFAQDWVKAMFEITSHDFGTVPQGAKSEFRFKITNKYEEDVHIRTVRSSCGCTIPRIDKSIDTLKTYQEGAVVCEFNTRAFVGPKSAVVTVVFDRPFYGEMQLNVKGNIRSDIATNPGEIKFGEVDAGTEKLTTVNISYAGTKDWRIEDVRSANQNLRVKLMQTPSSQGRRAYDMQVRLLDTAKAGEFRDQIVIVTNDVEFNQVTVPVTGTIVPPLVMPASVELGTIRSGNSVAQRLIIKGKEPFEITKIDCADGRFVFKTPGGKRKAHIIPVQFVAKDKIGAFREKVTVHTSLGDSGIAYTFVNGNVAK